MKFMYFAFVCVICGVRLGVAPLPFLLVTLFLLVLLPSSNATAMKCIDDDTISARPYAVFGWSSPRKAHKWMWPTKRDTACALCALCLRLQVSNNCKVNDNPITEHQIITQLHAFSCCCVRRPWNTHMYVCMYMVACSIFTSRIPAEDVSSLFSPRFLRWNAHAIRLGCEMVLLLVVRIELPAIRFDIWWLLVTIWNFARTAIEFPPHTYRALARRRADLLIRVQLPNNKFTINVFMFAHCTAFICTANEQQVRFYSLRRFCIRDKMLARSSTAECTFECSQIVAHLRNEHGADTSHTHTRTDTDNLTNNNAWSVISSISSYPMQVNQLPE